MTPILTPWQKQRLRQRLKAYKTHFAKGWTAVAEDIILSRSNTLEFPELSEEEEYQLDEAHRKGQKRIRPDVRWPIQGQDLLRFADGQINRKAGRREYTNTSPEKLEIITAFLVEEGWLPQNFLEIHGWGSWDHNALLSMSELFVDQERLPQELDGRYEHQAGDTCTLVEFIVPPDSTLAQVTYTVRLMPDGRVRPKHDQERTGWAFRISEASLLVLTGSRETGDSARRETDTHCVYGYELNGEEVSGIAIGLLGSTADAEPERALRDGVTPLIFQRSSDEAWLDDAGRDNVVGIGSRQGDKRKRKKKMSFSRDAATERWRRYLQGGDDKKRSSMTDADAGKAFLHAAKYGDDETLRSMIESGFDVNYADPELQCRALHLVASYRCYDALEELERSDDLEYLVVDTRGNLPSYYAMVASDDPELTDHLLRKEIAEAKAKGIDYKSVQKFEPEIK